MHRKSIYFLVLAVAALITLGIVMLFQHRRVRAGQSRRPDLFPKAADLSGSSSAWSPASSARAWITSSGSAPGGFGSRFPRCCWRCCYVPHVGLKINGARRWVASGRCDFPAIGFREDGRHRFPGALVFAPRKRGKQLCARLSCADAHYRDFDGTDRAARSTWAPRR